MEEAYVQRACDAHVRELRLAFPINCFYFGANDKLRGDLLTPIGKPVCDIYVCDICAEDCQASIVAKADCIIKLQTSENNLSFVSKSHHVLVIL